MGGGCLAEGTQAEGRGARSAPIAVIADIPPQKAKTGLSGDPSHRRDRKGKTDHGDCQNCQNRVIAKIENPRVTTYRPERSRHPYFLFDLLRHSSERALLDHHKE